MPVLLALCAACATSGADRSASSRLKHRVAVLPFENTTDFVTGTSEESYGVPLEERAQTLLMTQLRESGQVLLVTGLEEPLKADFVLTGQLVDFGRSTTTSTQLLVDSKRQSAHAAVSLSLVEVRSGQVLFTSGGSAKVASQSSRLFGMGDEPPFDGSLNEEALEDALSGSVDMLLERLQAQPWRTVVIAIEGDEVVIAGGTEQGLRVGDVLSVRQPGRAIESPQIEGTLELPSTELARLEIVTCFGAGANREGSVCRVIEGELGGLAFADLIVAAVR